MTSYNVITRTGVRTGAVSWQTGVVQRPDSEFIYAVAWYASTEVFL